MRKDVVASGLTFSLAAVSAAAVLAAAIAWPVPPLAPAVRPVTNSYFGHTLIDPYQYFERLDDPIVKKFFRQQADYTTAVLSNLGPGRETIRQDVTRLADAGASVSSISVVGQRIFYLERPPGVNDARLMVRDSAHSAPRLLLDADALGQRIGSKAHLSISTVLPSPDGSHVAVGLVPGGAEIETHTHIVNTADGTLGPEDIPRTWFGATAWSNDGKTLFYNQTPEITPGESQNDRELRSIAYRHTLGATTPDVPVFGIGLDPEVAFAPIDLPFIAMSPVSDYAVGVISHGVQNEATIYVAPAAAVTSAAMRSSMDRTRRIWKRTVRTVLTSIRIFWAPVLHGSIRAVSGRWLTSAVAAKTARIGILAEKARPSSTPSTTLSRQRVIWSPRNTRHHRI